MLCGCAFQHNKFKIMKRQNFVIAFALLFLISSILGCGKILNTYDPYPKDEVLQNNFYANKEDFDELVRLFQEDSSIFCINSQDEVVDFDKNKTNIASSRLDEYKRLFSKLHIQQINRSKFDQHISLRVWGIPNFLFRGKSKYYVFMETPPKNLESFLDDIYESGRDSNDFKKIEENWYLYLDVW